MYTLEYVSVGSDITWNILNVGSVYLYDRRLPPGEKNIDTNCL